MDKKFLRLAGILIMSLLFTYGCATVSVNGMLEVDPSQKDAKIDDVKFSLHVSGNNYTETAKKYYPNLFSDDFISLPVSLNLNCTYNKNDYSDVGALVFALTLTLVPGPLNDDIHSCSGDIELSAIDGYLIKKEVSYYFKRSVVVPGPLHWPFVPLVHSSKEFWPLKEMTDVEYAVRAIREAEPSKLRELYNYRKQRLQKITIYGEPYWAFLGFTQSEKAQSEGKGFNDIATVSFWKELPKNIYDKPIDRVAVAIYKENRWQPVKSIPRRLGLKNLTIVSVDVINNRPGVIKIEENVRPKVEYFVYLSNSGNPDEIRWSNNMLIEAKNLTFSDDLKQKDKNSLIEMQVDLEKEVLRLGEGLSKLELSLQQKLVEKKDVRTEKELIPLYEQRISIFEALITSIKQALKYR